MKLFYSVLSLLFVSFNCLAQVDSSYIGFFEEQVSVNTFWSKKFVFLNQEYGEDKRRTYMPNNPFDIGLGLSVNNTVLSFGYGYGFDFMRDRKLGKTKSIDFQ